MDSQIILASYRTRLSERRTAMAQIQLGFVLVTVPISVHSALMMLADRHAGARPFMLAAPGVTLAVLVTAAGVLLSIGGVKDACRAGNRCNTLKPYVDDAERTGLESDAASRDP